MIPTLLINTTMTLKLQTSIFAYGFLLVASTFLKQVKTRFDNNIILLFGNIDVMDKAKLLVKLVKLLLYSRFLCCYLRECD